MSNRVQAMIECPKGSNYKLDYEPKSKGFQLSKVLPAGLVFPFDFGMIPGTKGEDGDPLDIIVVSELSSFPGCLMDVRIVGVIQAEQTERDGKCVKNDRFIGIPMVSQMYSEVQELTHLPENILDQLEYFFMNYNEQAGKQFRVKARLPAEEALNILKL